MPSRAASIRNLRPHEEAFAIAIKDPEVLDQLTKLGVAPSYRSGADFHKYMKEMEPLFIQIMTESGMKTR